VKEFFQLTLSRDNPLKVYPNIHRHFIPRLVYCGCAIFDFKYE